MKILTTALILAATSTAFAQDLITQYTEASTIFGYPALLSEIESQIPAIEAMIGTLQGNWVPLSILTSTSVRTPEPKSVTLLCEKPFARAQRASAHSFSFTRDFKQKNGTAGAQSTIFQFVGGTTFLKFSSETEFFDRFGFDPTDATKAMETLSTLGNTGGLVSVLHPSKDILVILPLGGSPEIWGRCP